ncbi:hypothetical protein [Streptomyces spiramyceticus]|uniref:hypothetical protein n=1 Tax=Streptomyces spiramyceticus TaxID=299717 RepID=UPI00237B0D7B|nr:hypothetical protein [Streptomyces spiramyceticus]
MNALTTALRVLRWAVEGTGQPPGGPLQHTSGLIDPGADVRTALAELIRHFAARHGAGRPPLGDPEPASAGGVLLAAAIGGRMEPESACAVAEALPPRSLSERGGGWSDALARHAVVAPFLSGVPRFEGKQAAPQGAVAMGRAEAEENELRIGEVLLDASPLSAVLYRPAAGPLSRGATGAVRTASALVTRPAGRRLLCNGLAAWHGHAPVLDWRSQLLARLSADYPEVVLDTYLAARLRYGTEWDHQVRAARRRLAVRALPDELTLATVRFWAPLADLARRHPGLPATRPLLAGHQPAVELVRRYRLNLPATG